MKLVINFLRHYLHYYLKRTNNLAFSFFDAQNPDLLDAHIFYQKLLVYKLSWDHKTGLIALPRDIRRGVNSSGTKVKAPDV
jgi:hypothetical protein